MKSGEKRFKTPTTLKFFLFVQLFSKMVLTTGNTRTDLLSNMQPCGGGNCPNPHSDAHKNRHECNLLAVSSVHV